MKKISYTLAAALLLSSTPLLANEFEAQLTELANGPVAEVIADSGLIAAIEAQNAVTAGYDQAKIDELDQQWRAEVGAGSSPLIDEVLGNDASAYLKGVQDASQGLFTEIFAMDAVGLNVGQSGVTSDYWQGDEAKWQNTYQAGGVDMGDVELDESSQTFQAQLSVPVKDASGATIGAITFGVNVEYL